MAGQSVQIGMDARELQGFILHCLALGKDPERMVTQVCIYFQGETKRLFTEAPWPAKPDFWSYWQGGKDVPLTGATHKLGTSIAYDVHGAVGRVGSALPYAPSMQEGDDEPRSFYVYLYPELEAGSRGLRIARFTTQDGKPGYPKGKLAPKHEYTGESPLSKKAAGIGAKRSGISRNSYEDQLFGVAGEQSHGLKAGVIRVLVTQRIKARPFLKEPSKAQWGEIAAICERFLLAPGGRGALA